MTIRRFTPDELLTHYGVIRESWIVVLSFYLPAALSIEILGYGCFSIFVCLSVGRAISIRVENANHLEMHLCGIRRFLVT
jgi:hypothetical protein